MTRENVLTEIRRIAENVENISMVIMDIFFEKETEPVNKLETLLADCIETLKIVYNALGPSMIKYYFEEILSKCRDSDDKNFLLLAAYCAKQSNNMFAVIEIVTRLRELLEEGDGISNREQVYLTYLMANAHELAKFFVKLEYQDIYLCKAAEYYEKLVSLPMFLELPRMKRASIYDCLAYCTEVTNSQKEIAFEYQQQSLALIENDRELRNFYYSRHAVALLRIACMLMNENLVANIHSPRQQAFKYFKLAINHPRFAVHLSFLQQAIIASNLLSLYQSNDGDMVYDSDEYFAFVESLAHEKVKRILKGEESGVLLHSANSVSPEAGRTFGSKSTKEQVGDTALSL